MINSDITDMSNHKTSKGCGYFKQGWLGKVSYRATGSEHVFLRADSKHSKK